MGVRFSPPLPDVNKLQTFGVKYRLSLGIIRVPWLFVLPKIRREKDGIFNKKIE